MTTRNAKQAGPWSFKLSTLIRIQQASTLELINLDRAVFVCSNLLSCLSALPRPLLRLRRSLLKAHSNSDPVVILRVVYITHSISWVAPASLSLSPCTHPLRSYDISILVHSYSHLYINKCTHRRWFSYLVQPSFQVAYLCGIGYTILTTHRHWSIRSVSTRLCRSFGILSRLSAVRLRLLMSLGF